MTAIALLDDPELLDLFLEDMDRQSDLWKPTNYWKGHCARMRRELERHGLKGFRRNWNLMRGVDLGPKEVTLTRAPIVGESALARWARRLSLCRQAEEYVDELVARANASGEAHMKRQMSLLYNLLQQGERAKVVCSRVDDSGAGDPHLYVLDGRQYSSNMLHHIVLLSLLFHDAGTDEYQRVLEIGGGYGALAEALHKYRDVGSGYFVEVDIPPLVYVTTQYLKALFPEKVVDYRQVRNSSRITARDIQGKILVIPPWSVPALDLRFDLLWNSISFQEMEPDVVTNYLEFVGPVTNQIFINTRTAGHRKGLGGQVEQITFDWLADRLASMGYSRMARADCVEAAAFRSMLPLHSAALFARTA